MKQIACLLTVCGLCLAGVLLTGVRADQAKDNKPEKSSPLSKFMREKLGASNDILEGLVTDDFALVIQGAEKLEEMSKAEKFRVINDAIYRHFNDEFQRSVAQLKKDAKEHKIDAASLTWIKTTLNCIECHKYTKGMLLSGN